jgi:hypothetical protein
MAGLSGVLSLLSALGKVSARHVRSFGSIGGQNLFLFVAFVALQPESAAFFSEILVVVLLFPLSTDPMQALPEERRAAWPLGTWEWAAVRVVSWLLSPIVWIGIALALRLGWQLGALAISGGAVVQLLKKAAKRLPGITGGWLLWVPAPPGALGAIMRLQWRGMLRTLDPYVALVLSGSTTVYRFSGTTVDTEALRIMALVTALALSTHTQVLLGIDGAGSERYLQMPLRGWQILLAKDLAFLAMLAVLVAPLDLAGGVLAGIASLVIGHHVSVLNVMSQTPWRFTSGALIPWGLMQTVALFAVGNAVRMLGLPLIAGCLVAWASSVVFYGWEWDRRAGCRLKN